MIPGAYTVYSSNIVNEILWIFITLPDLWVPESPFIWFIDIAQNIHISYA